MQAIVDKTCNCFVNRCTASLIRFVFHWAHEVFRANILTFQLQHWAFLIPQVVKLLSLWMGLQTINVTLVSWGVCSFTALVFLSSLELTRADYSSVAWFANEVVGSKETVESGLLVPKSVHSCKTESDLVGVGDNILFKRRKTLEDILGILGDVLLWFLDGSHLILAQIWAGSYSCALIIFGFGFYSLIVFK